MSSDEILITMSRQIGEISGKLTEVGESQMATNNALYALAKDHEVRIKSVEGTRNQMIGAAAVAGVGSTGLLAAILKVFQTGTGVGH